MIPEFVGRVPVNALLEELDVNKRLQMVLSFIQDESDINELEKGIDSNVRKTIDTQHKEFLLRERMKAIKEELGEMSSKESDVEK